MSQRSRALAAALRSLCAAAAVALAWLCAAAPDLDRMQSQAAERFGSTAAELVAAWRRLLGESAAETDADKLARVNTFFNRRLLFEDDSVVWRQNDYWATPLETMGRGAGDCEDFAIAKYMTLRLLGVPADKLRLIYVRAQIGGPGSTASQAHMVLGYFAAPTDEPLVLDNLISEIRPAARRPDLFPVFSFNDEGLWVAGASTSSADPTARLSRWRDALDRMRREGLTLP
ncbi:transglutaminase-like cysteine peptidase [Azoarcus olearius]|nr:transglutaminase-like cysteine peptidase [Azoarcus olearius]